MSKDELYIEELEDKVSRLETNNFLVEVKELNGSGMNMHETELLLNIKEILYISKGASKNLYTVKMKNGDSFRAIINSSKMWEIRNTEI